MTKHITVSIDQSLRTSIHSGCGILVEAGVRLVEAGVRGKAIVITHEEVNKLYGQMLKESLEEQCIKCVFIDIPSGEEYKQWNTIARILPILKIEQVDRSCAIGSLGGGVAGDLAGFLASIYMRGTKCFHVPTTLLAQVDSSLGGKTAVNYQHEKNLLGTFYQPQVIVADVNLLESLPPREFAAGMAEAVKTALLSGEEFFDLLESALWQEPTKPASGHTWAHPIAKETMAEIVARCLDFKGQVVASDVFDLSHRHQLNLGHTFAHAIEAATGFTVYNHGEAVALGLLCALRLSQAALAADAALEGRVRTMLRMLGLPVVAELHSDEILKHFHADKKRHDGKARFVGLKAIGSFEIVEAPHDSIIRSALEAISV